MHSHIAKYIRVGSQLMVFNGDRFASAKDFGHSQNVVFIHGFTAHGRYLSSLMEITASNGANCFYFDYDSLGGIDTAAVNLMTLFNQLDALSHGEISKNKLTIVGHSMGGLVARAFASLPTANSFLKAVVTLGTPHAGALMSAKYLKYLVKWSENVAGVMPGYSATTCVSATQLMGTDNPTGMPLLEKLKEPSTNFVDIPFLSISGGKRWIEVGDNWLLNQGVNRWLQRQFAGGDNDGLILEKSSDFTMLPSYCRGSVAEHKRVYADYDKINHSNLVNSQTIALEIALWMDNLKSPQKSKDGNQRSDTGVGNTRARRNTGSRRKRV